MKLPSDARIAKDLGITDPREIAQARMQALAAFRSGLACATGRKLPVDDNQAYVEMVRIIVRGLTPTMLKLLRADLTHAVRKMQPRPEGAT